MAADSHVDSSCSRLSRPWMARLREFQGCTLAHPQLVEARDKLMATIQESPPNSLVMVFGPTGVGKTTLLAKVEQILTQSLLSALQTDRVRIPVVSVEAVAPESGNFNWRDQFKRILLRMKEPLVGYKLPEPTPWNEDRELYARPNSKTQGTEYRYAVEQALRYRRPLAVLIDEALELHAPSVSQCERMLSEAIEGELQLRETAEERGRLRTRLGLTVSNARDCCAPKDDRLVRRGRARPGERRPMRDSVGRSTLLHGNNA